MAEPKRILVIDDDADFLSYVQIMLSANGYEVLTAITAAEGLRRMHQDPPDLVIADVMMSYVLDGWTVSREMKADPLLREIPIIMVSAIVSVEDDGLFPTVETGGADAFLSKPLEPAALLNRVAELIRAA
jgi:CheY-like chemotaxis protein